MTPPSDWRSAGEGPRGRHLRAWLWTGAALTVLILVVGGVTRLTQSGLSIVDWDPIVGVVPPLTEAQWREAFERYRQFPEYRLLRQGMTLDEFRFIFFWEYIHRLAARAIGVVFLVPFLAFWARGYFTPPLRRRVLVLFALGAAQGLMGWYMVSSGLVDDPRVSHYRLAAHLSLALAIFGACVWLARELTPRAADGAPGASRWVRAFGLLLLAQIVWGAFVAGLDAGLVHNTFPRMGDGLVPPGALRLDPALRNLTENPVTVQWIHRLLGTLLLAGAALFALGPGRRAERGARRIGLAFCALVALQYALGVLTLLRHVPVVLGAAHQALAVGILGVWLVWLHRDRGRPAPAAGDRARRAGLKPATASRLSP